MRKATKALIIARVSTEEQAKQDEKFSLKAQLREAKDYFKTGGKFKTLKQLIDVKEIVESAFKGKRSKFLKAIEFIEESEEPIALVIYNVDRLQRRWNEFVYLDDLRREGKVEIHFVHDNLFIHQFSQFNEIQQWEMKVMFARNFSAMISENVKRSIKEQMNRGEFSNYVPNGYKNVNRESVDNPGQMIKKIIIDEEKAPFIKKCFALYKTGKYSLEKLARIMGEAGLAPKVKKARINGKLVVRKPKLPIGVDIGNILHNRFYTGKTWKADPFTGEEKLIEWKNYKPLITEQEYELVQEVLKKENSREKGFKKNKFKFQKLLTCGLCGCSFTAEEMSRTYIHKNKGQAQQVYYHCTSGKRVGNSDYYRKNFNSNNCPNQWFKEQEIEDAILIQFDKIDYGEDVFEFIRDQIEKDYSERIELVDADIKALKAKLGHTKNLINSYMDSLVTESDEELKKELKDRLDSLKQERDELKEEIRIMENARDIDTDEVIQNLEICFNLKNQYQKLNDEKKREMISLVFSEIKLFRDSRKIKQGKRAKSKSFRIEFTWNEPFNTVDLINWEEWAMESRKKEQSKSNLTTAKKKEASLFP